MQNTHFKHQIHIFCSNQYHMEKNKFKEMRPTIDIENSSNKIRYLKSH